MALLDDRRQRERAVVDGIRFATTDIGGNVVIEQIVCFRGTIRLNFDGLQIVDDRRHARLRGVRAVGVAATNSSGHISIAVVGIPVVGAAQRVGVLDLRSGGSGRIALRVSIIERVGVANHHLVCESSTHYWLVIVVVDRVLARQLCQVRHVALGDIVETHRNVTLLEKGDGGRARGRGAVTAS